MNIKRTIILDTETTGMNSVGLPHVNHRIIEIGAVEIIDRRFTGNNFHVYIRPDRSIESGAFNVHGISNQFLLDKPMFQEIADNFLKYIKNSKLVIHNAPFDLGFINQEFEILNKKAKKIETICSIFDTLKVARQLFPGKKNTLDALCTRYKINRSHRQLHSAIIDAQLLGKLYMLMTIRQESIFFYKKINIKNSFKQEHKTIQSKKRSLEILSPTQHELESHRKYLEHMKRTNICLWD